MQNIKSKIHIIYQCGFFSDGGSIDLSFAESQLCNFFNFRYTLHFAAQIIAYYYSHNLIVFFFKALNPVESYLAWIRQPFPVTAASGGRSIVVNRTSGTLKKQQFIRFFNQTAYNTI